MIQKCTFCNPDWLVEHLLSTSMCSKLYSFPTSTDFPIIKYVTNLWYLYGNKFCFNTFRDTKLLDIHISKIYVQIHTDYLKEFFPDFLLVQIGNEILQRILHDLLIFNEWGNFRVIMKYCTISFRRDSSSIRVTHTKFEYVIGGYNSVLSVTK